eukprot:353498-Chlamydomonas_euryale.AAC.3
MTTNAAAHTAHESLPARQPAPTVQQQEHTKRATAAATEQRATTGTHKAFKTHRAKRAKTQYVPSPNGLSTSSPPFPIPVSCPLTCPAPIDQ